MVVVILVLAALFSVAPVRAERVPKCRFAAGALPAQTLRSGKPHGTQIPIDTVVVLMQENRSFDHYLGQLHNQGQPHSRRVPPGASNPDPTNPANPPITPFHQTKYCEVADLDHSWNGTHNEWNGGKMDGFTAANQDATNDPNGHRTMGYYDSGDLPFYYALYRTFAMADHYFCSTLTQTFPNRFYLLAATSFGHIANDFPTGFTGIPAIGGGTTGTEFTQPTIFNLLDNPCFPNAAGSCSTPPVTWKIYHNEIAFAYEFGYVRMHAQNVVPYNPTFAADAAAGLLPNVAFIDPIFIGPANVETDEHPPSNIQVGQQFVANVISTLMSSPQWYAQGRGAALFLTYDEHGGFYDHLPPPPACVPDDKAPMLRGTCSGTTTACTCTGSATANTCPSSPDCSPGVCQITDVVAEFDRYGIRVPFVLVSPFARNHYVSHRTYDHTSILRFIESRFDLPALTKRDANADPMLRLFNFKAPPFTTPPALPGAPVDSAHQQDPQCVNGMNGAP